MIAHPTVGFDGLQHTHPATGSGQYATNLWRQLCRRDGNPLNYTLLAPKAQPRVKGNVGKLAWEQLGLPGAVRREKVDLVHVPYFSLPLVQRVPHIVTIHDVIPLAMPVYASSCQMRTYLRLVTRSARRARLVITDSSYSRDEIVRLLGIPASRIRVILLGASEEFQPVGTFQDETALDRLREKYELRRPFVLNVGGFDVRKRLAHLIRGFALAVSQLEVEHDLVIVGSPHTDNPVLNPPVEPLITSLGLVDRVKLVGFVSEEDKRDLYRAATVFAFTSECEGFGLNPLEAMACGAPVICSNRASLPEVVGDAALFVDPEPEAIGAALVAMLRNPDLRADYSLRGRARAAKFTWERTADQTVAVYQEVLNAGMDRR